MSPQPQGPIESVREYNMPLITEDLGVKLTEEITSQNASGRCKCKNVWTYQLVHRESFSLSGALLLY